MCQNSVFKANNRFKKRTNRFTNPIFIDEGYNYFDFNGNLKSNDISELNFTNFVSSNLSKKYIDLERICLNINDNNSKWSKMFVADEIDINKDIPKINRIYQIISKVNEKEIKREELILKFKNLDDKEIQFYIKNENRNT